MRALLAATDGAPWPVPGYQRRQGAHRGDQSGLGKYGHRAGGRGRRARRLAEAGVGASVATLKPGAGPRLATPFASWRRGLPSAFGAATKGPALATRGVSGRPQLP